jgi:transcriptional regulatory protein AMDR
LCQPTETDQPPLTEAHLVETDGSMNKNIHLQYCVHSTALCHIVADIINMHSLGPPRKNGLSETSAIDARLAAWFMALPPGDDFYMLQLRLQYNTALFHLHRAAMQVGTCPDLTYSTGTAVDSIVSLFASIIQTRTIRRCYITASTAVMAAAIHMTRELHLAIEQHSTLVALQSQSQLEGLFPIMRELAQSWPTTNAVLKLFQHILERSWTTTASQSGNSANLEPVVGAADDYPPLDWDVIFSTLHPDNSQQSDYDWSNVASWITN